MYDIKYIYISQKKQQSILYYTGRILFVHCIRLPLFIFTQFSCSLACMLLCFKSCCQLCTDQEFKKQRRQNHLHSLITWWISNSKAANKMLSNGSGMLSPPRNMSRLDCGIHKKCKTLEIVSSYNRYVLAQ